MVFKLGLLPPTTTKRSLCRATFRRKSGITSPWCPVFVSSLYSASRRTPIRASSIPRPLLRIRGAWGHRRRRDRPRRVPFRTEHHLSVVPHLGGLRQFRHCHVGELGSTSPTSRIAAPRAYSNWRGARNPEPAMHRNSPIAVNAHGASSRSPAAEAIRWRAGSGPPGGRTGCGPGA